MIVRSRFTKGGPHELIKTLRAEQLGLGLTFSWETAHLRAASSRPKCIVYVASNTTSISYVTWSKAYIDYRLTELQRQTCVLKRNRQSTLKAKCCEHADVNAYVYLAMWLPRVGRYSYLDTNRLLIIAQSCSAGAHAHRWYVFPSGFVVRHDSNCHGTSTNLTLRWLFYHWDVRALRGWTMKTNLS